jgi:hypothetical protein
MPAVLGVVRVRDVTRGEDVGIGGAQVLVDDDAVVDKQAGVGRGGPADDVVIRGDKEDGEFIAFWLDGDRVTAGMNVNIWDVHSDIRAIIKAGKPVDRDRLADPSTPLADVAQ